MKNNFNRFWAVLCLLSLGFSPLFAERVSETDAALVANHFMNGVSSSSVKKSVAPKRMVLKKSTAAEEPQYYVYENADGEGWVMVAANDIARPIIAYSDEGSFRTDNQPENLKHWLGRYNAQIKQAEENGVSATEEVTQEWSRLRKGGNIRKGTPVVAALIKTKWDQDAPYWKYCPKKNGTQQTLTGCVATAMAQVMYYWKWPEKGTGSYSYSTQTLGLSCSADFANTTYDWDNMLEKYTQYYNEGSSNSISTSSGNTAQQDAVATLMYHCGVAVAMDYNVSSAGGSGAQTIRPNASYSTEKCAQNALYQNFGYKSTTVKGYYRPGGYGYSVVSDANWHNYLKTELDAARPIMYAGGGYEDINDDDTYYGHSFICDGYDDTTPTRKYHFNWGWSGYCDGYYDIENLVPGTGGSGAGQGEYLYDHDIIIGIIPDKPDVTVKWNVQGSETSQTFAYGASLVPSVSPSGCSGGKEFVGWTESSTITGGTRPSDLFTSGEKTATEATTYYAVYATASGSGGGGSSTGSKTFTFSSIASANSWTNGTAYTEVEDSPVTITAEGGGNNGKWYTSGGGSWRMYSGGTVTIAVTSGSVTSVTSSPSCDFTISNGEATFSPSARTDFTVITVNYSTSGGSGTSYSDYSLTCTTCSNTPEMSFSPATVNKTTADDSFTKVVSMSGNGSGQTAKYSSSDETVATVNNSGVVTLKGKVGTTTITASVAASGDYCPASASYTLNVTAAPIDVTLYYNGTSTNLTNQTSPYTLPTGTPYNTAMCSGDWTFAGWYGSAYTKSETEPTYITELTATGSAYAVYTTTETSGGGGSSTGSKTFTFSSIASANNWENGVAYTSVVDAPVTITASGGGNNGKWYTSSGGSWRMYSGGTVTIAVASGSVTSVTSSPSCDFTISNGEATFSPSARTDFTEITVAYSVGGGGSSTTYYATSPECATPCSNTPEMSFANTTVDKTTDDATYTQAVTITGKGSGQTVGYSSSDESVATVDNSGVVTLKGKVGSTTITASVEASGMYCAASASYTLNVSAAPIDITLYYNGTSATLTNQTSPYTLPTGTPYNTAMCGGDWTFAGWYGSAYTKSETEPTYITELTATGSAYAVYTTTETSGSGGSSTGSKTFTFSSIASANSWINGEAYTPVVDAPVTITAEGGGNNGKWYTSGSGSWRMYSGGTVTIAVASGSVTSVTSSPSCSFSISEGVATFSPSARTDFTSITVEYSVGGSGSSTTYYATTPECATPCTNKVALTKGTPSNGSFALDKEDGEYNNCSAGGLVVTVSGITPASGYQFKEITQTGISSGVSIDQDSKTVTYDKDVTGSSTINVVFELIPTYTVTWSSNGDDSNTATYHEGEDIVFPTSADGCDTKTFMGWVGAAISTPQDEAPTFVTSATMGTSDLKYYAVFADEDGDGETYKLVSSLTNGKEYIFVNRNTDGNGYALSATFSSNQNTGTAVSITTSGSDKIVSGTPGNAIIWIASTGWSLKNKSTDTYLKITGSAFELNASGSTNLTFNNANYGLNGQSGTGSTKYYVQCEDGVFTKSSTTGSTSNRVWAYEKSGSTAYSGYTTSCVIPTEVTVTFDANGGTGTMAAQTIPYNTATALTANAFTREGYTFQGWATSSTGDKVHNDQASVTLKKNTTLYAVWQKNSYTITIDEVAHATIVTSPASTAEFEATVTVTVTPASGYTFGSITVTNNTTSTTITTSGTGNEQTFTMPASNVTVTATVNEIPKYTVTWSMDGDISTTAEYEAGQAIVFPTTATGCDGRTFMGWVSEAITTPQDNAPTYVTSATMGTSNLIYYAVYAEEDNNGSGSNEWVLVESLAGITNGTYVIENGGYALPSTTTSSSPTKSSTYSITVSNKKITSTVSDAMKWSFTMATGYVATIKNAAGSYLYCTNANTGLRVGSTEDTWTFELNNSAPDFAFYDDNQGKYCAAYNNGSDWRSYGSADHSNYEDGGKIHLYKQADGTSYTGYTTSCGASVNAKNIGWITATKGQKVKRDISVSAKGFDEATTLSVACANTNFHVSLAETAVSAGASGLTTTLTVEYNPADYSIKDEDVEITLTAGDQSKTITVSGCSLPEEFLLITKKTSTSTWYALPANMTGGANEYDGIAVSPNDPTTPTAVAVSPSTLIYNMASVASSRYADNGHLVRLVGNGDKCLWGSKATGATKVNIQNYATLGDSNGDNYEWDLKTTDGIHYFVESPCNAEYASGRRLAYGSKFGMYKEETVFYIVEAGCTSQPGDVNVSPRRAEATFSWESNATSMKIDVYTNEGMTSLFKSETATSSPYVMKGLTEETNYWFKLIPTGDEACAVTGSFKTTGPTIDIAEWQETAVVVQIDHGDVVPSIVIDGQEEHGSITGGGGTATELFFAKYFEGAGSMKLVSIFNGTKNAIPLTNYKFFDRHAGGGASSYGGDTEYDLSSLGSIEAGQEIIFFTRPQDSETDMTDCSSAFLDEVAGKSAPTENPRWIECDGQKSYGEYVFSKITFNGNDALLLKKGGDIIDVIGSLGTPGKDKNCKSEDAWAGTIKNMAYDAERPKHASGAAYAKFFEESSLSPVSTADSLAILNAFGVDLTNPEINISTARCIFFRDKRVTSGDSAVQMNTAGEFKTFTTHVEGGQTYKAEWYGRSVCMTNAMKTAAGVASDAQATCNSYQDIANMDYKDYYIDYSSNVIPEQTLNPSWKDEETNLYTIPIPEMSKYTCLNLRFQLKREGEVVTEKAQQVPILISDEVDTNDPLFSELVVDKVDENDPSTWTPLYSQSKQRCSTCDVVVLGTGTLTKVADTDSKDVPEVGNVKIYPGGKLVVPDETNYTVNSLSFRRQEDNLSTADIQGNLNIKEDGNHVYFDLRVDPSNWHYIALPYDCNIADIRFVNDEERIPILGTDYLLKYYDGEKRAATQSGGCWEMVQSDGVLKKGIGYIFGIPGSDKVQREFRFPMSNEVVNEEKDPAGKLANGVYAYGGDKEITVVRANHRGWNLLGNPYLLPYTSDIESPVMTGYIVEDHSTDPWDGHYMFATDARSNLRYIVEPVDNGRSEYVQKAITSYKMKPFTSYFVQIGGTDPEAMQGVQFNLNKVDRSASPVRRSPALYEETADTHPVWVMINMTNDKGEKDETTMLISDDFTNGYDMMDDLVKMRGTYYQYAQITTKPVLASRNDEGEMAFNALPDSTARLGIPLNFFAAAQGQYTIALDGRYSLEEVKEVQLYDSELNNWHNLKTEDYVFTVTKKGDNTTRFKLYVTVERKQPQTPTEIDNIYGKLTLTTADRTLILSGLREDADIYVYDTSGKLVAADRHTTDGNNSVWRTTVATQGVYFVRVMTGNEPQILNTIVY